MKGFILCLGSLAFFGIPDDCSATLSGSHADRSDAGGVSTFQDVSPDHWAYQAVKKMAEGGYIPGWHGQFQGDRPLSRYQLAFALTKIIENLHTTKKGGRLFTAEDISNLEALTLEFADELTTINSKVKDLEEDVDGIQKDLAGMKTELGPRGKRSPISGVISARLVSTATSRPGYGQSVLAADGSLQETASAATPPMLRYHGDVSGPEGPIGGATPGSAPNPYRFDGKNFFTLAQFSLEVDRKINQNVGVHAQFDINGEMDDGLKGVSIDGTAKGGAVSGVGGFDLTPTNGVIGGAPDRLPSGASLMGRLFEASAPVALADGPFVVGTGRGQSFRGTDIHINEAYIQMLDVLAILEVRAGIQALPFNTEANGPARTYDWTLTPSVMNTHWESYRPVGLELRQSEGLENIRFNLGVFSGVDRATGGTLLSGTQGARGPGDSLTGAVGPQDPFGNSTETGLASGMGRLPTPRLAVMTDAPQGVNRELEADGIGCYLNIAGTGPAEEGFDWQLGYLDNGGKLARQQADRGTEGDWEAFQVMARYRWTKWLTMAQYYVAATRNYSLIDLTTDSGFTESDRRFRGSPFPTSDRLNTRSEGISLLLRYMFDKQNIATLRLERAKDETGTSEIGGLFLTATYTRPMSEASVVQVEYIGPRTWTRADNGSGRGVDIQDDLMQVNYRLSF